MKTQKKSDGTKLYTHKIPKRVRRALKQFTQSDCYLVKRRRSGKTSEGKYRNCHTNVAYWVEHIGGESVDGWMLQREKGLLNNGWWSWAFHSVWKTPEGNLVDVTQNPLHEGKTHITFWKDKTEESILLMEFHTTRYLYLLISVSLNTSQYRQIKEYNQAKCIGQVCLI